MSLCSVYFICFWLSGSSLPCGLFSSCYERAVQRLSGCGVRATHCGGFSCGAWVLGNVGFSCCITWDRSVVAVPKLQSTGSIVMACRLSCPMVCGTFLDHGSYPCLLHWRAASLPLSHQGSPVCFYFFFICHISLESSLFVWLLHKMG